MYRHTASSELKNAVKVLHCIALQRSTDHRIALTSNIRLGYHIALGEVKNAVMTHIAYSLPRVDRTSDISGSSQLMIYW